MSLTARFIISIVLTGGCLFGCASNPTEGYATTGLYQSDIQTIAVPILENDTFDRGLEFELTDALIKEIEGRTPYRIMGQTRADTVLLAQIRQVELTSLSKSRLSGLSEEQLVSVTIDFRWEDLRTGRSLLERRAFTGHGLFVPSTPSGEPIELAQFNAVQSLARDIVSEMRSEW